MTERIGAKPRQFGQLFKMNPRVSDIPDAFCLEHKGIKLIVMGAVQKGGAGCACPENVLLRSLLSEIILNRDEVVIVDMEAGIEHLGRATAGAINKMLIVVEPGSRSIATAQMIMRLSEDIGLRDFGIIGNKIRTDWQKKWIKKQCEPLPVLGLIPYSDAIQDSDLNRKSLIETIDTGARSEFDKIYSALRLA